MSRLIWSEDLGDEWQAYQKRALGDPPPPPTPPPEADDPGHAFRSDASVEVAAAAIALFLLWLIGSLDVGWLP